MINISDKDSFFCPIDLIASPSYELNVHIQNEEREDHTEELCLCAGRWSSLAVDKQRLSETPEEKALFNDSSEISNHLENTISKIQQINKKINKQRFEILFSVSNDPNRTIQAISVVKNKDDNTVYLEFLATNPNNIRARVNESQLNQVKGAGSSIVSKLFEKCVQNKQDSICLKALASSVSFYEKLGFEVIKEGYVMQITLEKIKKILNEKRGISSQGV